MKYINGRDNPGEPFPITIIRSRFNQMVTEQLLKGALQRLEQLGFSQSVTVIEVPGAVEIPLTAQWVAKRGLAQAIITLGAVIRGETSHYDYVCSQVSDGCMRVALDYNLPVVFGLLTTENVAQAMDRVGGNHGHKGIESVDVALEMHAIKSSLFEINQESEC